MYDTTYFQQGEEIGKKQAAQDRSLDDIMSEIITLKTRGDSDFEGLTELYRRTFIYLVVHSGLEGFEDRALEREIVAALESVFPRVGLRTFVTLVDEDKATQIKELATIVFGIRLFNREIGKGGTGITDVPGTLNASLSTLEDSIKEQKEQMGNLCKDYAMTINYMHRQKDSKGIPPRLRDELTNRRQYLGCLQNLYEDCATLRQRAGTSFAAYQMVLEELNGIIGSKSSVPKEQVYPKFDRLAKVWKEMEDDLAQVNARINVKEGLLSFKSSFNSRLRTHDIAAARKSLEDDVVLAETVQSQQDAVDEMISGSHLGLQLPSDSSLSQSIGRSSQLEGYEGGQGRVSDVAPAGGVAGFSTGPGGAVVHQYDVWRRSHGVNDLSMGRYCPWTIAKRDSLVLFSRPQHGIIEYSGRFYAFASLDALEDALRGMEGLLQKVYIAARRAPELIQLLNLGHVFPTASISAIVEASIGGHQGKSTVCDGDTQTLTHVLESNIDPQYEWNEWSLRRKGLQLANLRGKRTHSTQTTTSHFRRETDTQTFEPKNKEVSTLKDAKTQAPKMVSYMTGLRGRPTKTFTVVGMTLE